MATINNAINNTSSVLGTTTTLTAGTTLTVSSGDMTVTSGNITLPNTTSSVGQVTIAGTAFLHGYEASNTNTNTFIGSGAGNFTTSALYLTAVGYQALHAVTTTASNGTVAIGYQACYSQTAASACVGIGTHALYTNQTGGYNTAIGYYSQALVTGSYNVSAGGNSLDQLAGGSNNIAYGYQAGHNYTGTESSNICIGHLGIVGDNNTIRLGTNGSGNAQQNACFIAGIWGNSASIGAGVVTVDSNSQMANISGGSVGQVLAGGSPPAWSDSLALNTFLTVGTYITAMAGDITATAGNVYVGATSNDTNSKSLIFTKIRGTSALTTGDDIGALLFQGYDGSSYITTSQIRCKSGGTINTNRIASNLTFYTHPDSTTTSTLRMTISSTGTVEIAAPDSGNGLKIDDGGLLVQAGNTTLVATYGTTVGGTNAPVLIDSTGLLGTVSSSIRFKENIEDMGSESAPIMRLRPVTFTYKADDSHRKQYGLIAEEVDEIFPALVDYDDDNVATSVRYHELPAILLNELIKQIDALKFLEMRVDRLESHGDRK